MAELEARTPTLTITPAGSATPVSLQVDGAPLGVAALGSPVPLDPGDHTVVVQFAAGAVSRQVALVERQRATVSVEPEGPDAVAAATPTGRPAPALAPPTTGGIFYLLARSAIAPVTSACPSSPCAAPSGSPLPGDYRDAQSKQTVALVLASAGAVVAATGLVLLATGGTSAAPTASAQLSPWVGPTGGGASVSGRF